MINILKENGSPEELKKVKFKEILSKSDLDLFKWAITNRDEDMLVDWCIDSRIGYDTFHLNFLPYLVYLLSSVDSKFATDFLLKYIKRINAKDIILYNLAILKFEDIIGVDVCILNDCVINKFYMLSNNLYQVNNSYIKELIIDEDCDATGIVNHLKAQGTTIGSLRQGLSGSM